MRILLLVLVACGAAPRAHEDAESRYGPLEVGADYATYRKVSAQPFLSRAHGDRWVEVYVTAEAADAYLSGDDMPAGAVVVKTSWLDEGGAPSRVAGPIFVMRKEPAGTDPAREDWWYAIHWAAPVGEYAEGGPIYWRGHSKKAEYCWLKCHDNYDRGLGGLTPSSLVPR
jgi:hypothetical protein